MFAGFIAVIIILLIIVALMITGSTDSSDSSKYNVEAKKVQTLLSAMRDESKFYSLSQHGSYKGITMNYFADNEFAKGALVYDSIDKDDWEGYPEFTVGGSLDPISESDTAFPDVYNYPSIKLGGAAGDNMRIIVGSVDNGKNAVFFIVKRKGTEIPELYLRTLEKSLSADSNYIGG